MVEVQLIVDDPPEEMEEGLAVTVTVGNGVFVIEIGELFALLGLLFDVSLPELSTPPSLFRPLSVVKFKMSP